MQALAVVFEDDDLILINKPTGLAVIPERWEPDAASLLALVDQRWPGALAAHRIDKETSGLALFGKTAAINNLLQAAFETRAIHKTYRALVWGRPGWETTSCDLPLLADGNRQHQTVVSHKYGKSALTLFRRLAIIGPCSLIQAEPETGRTHQIRVHAKELGFPIVGDALYGGRPLFVSHIKRHYRGNTENERPLLARTALHAAALALNHPRTGLALAWQATDPADFAAAIRQLEKA